MDYGDVVLVVMLSRGWDDVVRVVDWGESGLSVGVREGRSEEVEMARYVDWAIRHRVQK